MYDVSASLRRYESLRGYQQQGIRGLADFFADEGLEGMEGIKLKVSTDELRSHLRIRAEHHIKRADTKESQLPKLRETAEAIKKMPQAEQSGHAVTFGILPQGTGRSPGGYLADFESQISLLERDIKNHQMRAQAFKFAADHLFDEDYTLTISELQELEIVGRNQ